MSQHYIFVPFHKTVISRKLIKSCRKFLIHCCTTNSGATHQRTVFSSLHDGEQHLQQRQYSGCYSRRDSRCLPCETEMPNDSATASS